MAGYCLELITIPALALVGENGWIAAVSASFRSIFFPLSLRTNPAVQHRLGAECFVPELYVYHPEVQC